MIIYGTFIKHIWRNEKTGFSQFLINRENSLLICEGNIINFPFKAPLFIVCDKKRTEEGEIYIVSKVELSGYNKEVMIELSKTKELAGIGPKTMETAMGMYGDDLFKYVRTHYYSDSSKTNNLSVSHLMKIIKEFVAQEDIVSFINRMNGSYLSAMKLYKKYGTDCLMTIKKNPYLLLECDIKFSECEKIAIDSGIKEYDLNRVASITNYILEQNRKNGNSRINIYELEDWFNRLESSVQDRNSKTKRLFIAESLASERYKVVEENGNINVYFAEDYIIEKRIADSIRKLNCNKKENASLNKELIYDIADKLEISYSDEQIEAFDCLKSTGIKIITGGPGTGKTTLLNGLLEAYETLHPSDKIMLAAPTGCAAVRMQKSTNRFATTLHKTLNIQPFTNIASYSNKLDAKCIVVDEVSMVDMYMFNALLSSLQNDVTLILIGDKDQLPSVGAGNILEDLIKSKEIEFYHLSKIFRQAADNLIVKNSYNVIHGNTNIETNNKFQVRRFGSEAEILSELNKIVESCKAKKITDYKVFTPSRNVKFETGSIKLNRMLQNTNNRDLKIRFGYYTFSVGDKVMFNSNNYDKGYYNGEEGIILDIQKVRDTVHMTILADGERINLVNAEIDDIDLGYAITAHKSQGSECGNAIIIVPQNPKGMLKRKLLYVEISRAKKNVVILSEGDALEKCIKEFREKPRNTGLVDKLKRQSQLI